MSEGISCDVLDWWKANSARFPLIAKVAQIVLISLVQKRFASVCSSRLSTLE